MQRRIRRAGRRGGFLALLFLGTGLFLLGAASSPVSETSSITAAFGPVSETSSITAASGPVSETSSFTAPSSPVSETSSSTAAGPLSETSSLTTTSGPVSETSSNTTALRTEPQDEAQTAPTYVSELAPAVMLAPEPAALPATGARAGAGTPWPKATGLALALLGGLFIYAARAVRTEDTQ